MSRFFMEISLVENLLNDCSVARHTQTNSPHAHIKYRQRYVRILLLSDDGWLSDLTDT